MPPPIKKTLIINIETGQLHGYLLNKTAISVKQKKRQNLQDELNMFCSRYPLFLPTNRTCLIHCGYSVSIIF